MPDRLRSLHIWNCGLRSVDGTLLPEGLERLELCFTDTVLVNSLVLPESLLTLCLSHLPVRELDIKHPENLRELYLDGTHIESLDGVNLSVGLRILDIRNTGIDPDKVKPTAFCRMITA